VRELRWLRIIDLGQENTSTEKNGAAEALKAPKALKTHDTGISSPKGVNSPPSVVSTSLSSSPSNSANNLNSVHLQMIQRRWQLISKMDQQAHLPSPCVSVCLTNAENICTGCFRSLEEISGWANFTPPQQLEIWKKLIYRIDLTTNRP